ncbi:oxygenase MpaB family protein [Marinactinospora rubrisoli]|uniref:Oxygenase MpaB family protein n=1 Tax=Marinactinospora rubrisoli TaxID=2715399 RepID=A0ABW2KIK6_9ACTN
MSDAAPFPPHRLVNAEAARARHGEDAVRLVADGLRAGDPVADSVIAELDALGAPAREALRLGLRNGLGTLDSAPPAVAALLREAETPSPWADAELIARGDTVGMSVSPFWNTMAFALGSLVHTYSAPGLARVLVGTGRLTAAAGRRLAETGLWKVNAGVPGGLTRGAPGYLDTLQVRLLHARVRAGTLRRGWDIDTWGVPVNQVDTARTWLDFTLVPFRALARVGITLTETEEADLYRYWHHIAHLLGLAPEFHRHVHDHATAAALLDLIDSTNAAPDDNSRALVTALIDVTAGPVGARLSLPEPATRTMLAALTRLMQGDEVADALHIERVDIAPFLPLIAMGNTTTRRWQRFTPESWHTALTENTKIREAEYSGVTGAEYRSHLAAPEH